MSTILKQIQRREKNIMLLGIKLQLDQLSCAKHLHEVEQKERECLAKLQNLAFQISSRDAQKSKNGRDFNNLSVSGITAKFHRAKQEFNISKLLLSQSDGHREELSQIRSSRDEAWKVVARADRNIKNANLEARRVQVEIRNIHELVDEDAISINPFYELAQYANGGI